jgi:hypothetical protein
MSDENKKSNELFIPALAGAAIAYFAANKKSNKIANIAKELVTKAIDDCANTPPKVIDVSAAKQLPLNKFKGYPKTKVRNENKNN